jgi:hypothetical protein
MAEKKLDAALDDILEGGGIKVHPTLVQGRTFDVYVDCDGDFLCSVDGRRVDGVSLEELRAKINHWLNESKVRVFIPVTVVTKGAASHGTIVGVTTNNENFSFLRDDGRLEELPFYNVGYGIRVFHRLNQPQVDELLRLTSNLNAAKAAAKDFDDAWSLDLREALRDEFKKQHELLNASTLNTPE